MPHKVFKNEVYSKFDGCCAYCGSPITLKNMQINHIIPIYRGWADLQLERFKLERGTDELINLNPSCRVCNKWKSTWTIEQFRNEIQQQIKRLNERSAGFRIAKTYGLIQEIKREVKFHFENIKQSNNEKTT